MRFVQYVLPSDSTVRLGGQLNVEDDIVEISSGKSEIPNSLVSLIKNGPEAIEKAEKIVAAKLSTVKINDVKLLPPIISPDKVVCVGLNYKKHCEEHNKAYPKEPIFFNKFPSTIVGPSDNVIHPPNAKFLDWEIELAVIIGKTCRQVTKENVDEYIFGYTVANDITARDWHEPNVNAGQWLFAKSMDTFCPLGPAVVTKTSIGDPHKLELKCSVNGKVMQLGNTDNLIHNIHSIVSFLSGLITLLPGDVILTGTPAGVGIFLDPPMPLKPGDIVESEIEAIGKLRNRITAFSS